MNNNNDDGGFTWEIRNTWSRVYICTSKCGWGRLNCSPSLLSWEPRLSVTQTTSYTWLASGHMNTDAIKPTLCLANTYWQAFSQSSVCDTVTGGEVMRVVHFAVFSLLDSHCKLSPHKAECRPSPPRYPFSTPVCPNPCNLFLCFIFAKYAADSS